jgi:sugar phosphate isomerase/epimerase
MNPIGIHYGYWTQFWGSEPIQFVKRAQKCGFDILEVNAPKVTRMSDSERGALKGAAADAGLGLTYSIGMNTAAEGIAFAERVGSPNCKILLDTFHMNIEEDSMGGSIEEAGTWLGHFHLGEQNRRPPGRGRMPWSEIFGALKKINYQGAVVMEPFLVPGGEVGRDISVFRDLLGNGDLDEEAALSVQFVSQGEPVGTRGSAAFNQQRSKFEDEDEFEDEDD